MDEKQDVKCRNCGTENPCANMFCGTCGKPLTSTNPSNLLGSKLPVTETTPFNPPLSPSQPLEPEQSKRPPNIRNNREIIFRIISYVLLFISITDFFVGLNNLINNKAQDNAIGFFASLFALALTCWLVGLNWPKTLSTTFKRQPTRKQIHVTFGLPALAAFLMGAFLAPTYQKPNQVTPKTEALKAVKIKEYPKPKQVHAPVVKSPPNVTPKQPPTPAIETQSTPIDEADSFMKTVRLSDPDGVLFVSASSKGDNLTITVTDAWHEQNHQVRLEFAQKLWQYWATIHSPKSFDDSHIKIVDYNGNRVGGSSMWAGSLVSVID